MLEVELTRANTGLMLTVGHFKAAKHGAEVLRTRVLLVYCLDVCPRAFYALCKILSQHSKFCLKVTHSIYLCGHRDRCSAVIVHCQGANGA
jgi:hypothetical protein